MFDIYTIIVVHYSVWFWRCDQSVNKIGFFFASSLVAYCALESPQWDFIDHELRANIKITSQIELLWNISINIWILFIGSWVVLNVQININQEYLHIYIYTVKDTKLDMDKQCGSGRQFLRLVLIF